MAKRNHTDVLDDGPDRKRKTVLANVNVNIVEKNERHKSKRKLEDIEKIERALLDVTEKPQVSIQIKLVLIKKTPLPFFSAELLSKVWV